VWREVVYMPAPCPHGGGAVPVLSAKEKRTAKAERNEGGQKQRNTMFVVENLRPPSSFHSIAVVLALGQAARRSEQGDLRSLARTAHWGSPRPQWISRHKVFTARLGVRSEGAPARDQHMRLPSSGAEVTQPPIAALL